MKYRTALNAILLVFVTGVSLSGQNGCPPLGDPGTATSTISMKTFNGVCTVQNGGYVRHLATYKVHINATVSGGCITRGLHCSGLPPVCMCVVNGTYLRYVGVAALHDAFLNPNSPFGSIVAAVNQTSMDSTVPTGTLTNGVTWSAGLAEMERTITSNTSWSATVCGFSPASFASEPFKVNVMACKPEWYVEGTPEVNFRAPATGTVKIVIPNGLEPLRGPAEDAAADWEAALGRDVEVQSGWGSCTATDPLCVELADDYPFNTDGCAEFDMTSADQNGIFTGSSTIRLRADWVNAHVDVLRRKVAHELGHYFGLGNRLAGGCSNLNSVMASGWDGCYSADPAPQGAHVGPSLSDITAVTKSTYGNQVRSTCGW